MAKRKQKAARTKKKKPKRKLKILVSSSVYGNENLLDSIYALLDDFGYEVLMSCRGTVSVDPSETAMDCCLDAVEECDLFLGVILPWYGSGKEDDDSDSITHREMIEAIALNKPRWFLVHEHVALARQIFGPFRKMYDEKNPLRPFEFKEGMKPEKLKVISDIRVIDMFELATRLDVPNATDRKGNWVQHFGPDKDARLFVTYQFRRYRELTEKYLPMLDVADELQSKLGANK